MTPPVIPVNPTLPNIRPLPARPGPGDLYWGRLARIYNALRVQFENPGAIGALANADMESSGETTAVGDNDTAYNLWQWHWNPRGISILDGCKIDVRVERSPTAVVQALMWELKNKFPHLLEELHGATSAEDAASAFCSGFEFAGASQAMLRRRLDAAWLTVWVSENDAFIKANPAN